MGFFLVTCFCYFLLSWKPKQRGKMYCACLSRLYYYWYGSTKINNPKTAVWYDLLMLTFISTNNWKNVKSTNIERNINRYKQIENIKLYYLYPKSVM